MPSTAAETPRHAPQPAQDEPVETVWGEGRQKGELDAGGRCPDCGLNYAANAGVYHCFACSEDW